MNREDFATPLKPAVLTKLDKGKSLEPFDRVESWKTVEKRRKEKEADSWNPLQAGLHGTHAHLTCQLRASKRVPQGMCQQRTIC